MPLSHSICVSVGVFKCLSKKCEFKEIDRTSLRIIILPSKNYREFHSLFQFVEKMSLVGYKMFQWKSLNKSAFTSKFVPYGMNCLDYGMIVGAQLGRLKRHPKRPDSDFGESHTTLLVRQFVVNRASE